MDTTELSDGLKKYVHGVIADEKVPDCCMQCTAQAIAAIAEGFYVQDAAKTVYEKYGPSLNGFPGVWLYVGEAAVVFEAVYAYLKSVEFSEGDQAYLGKVDGKPIVATECDEVVEAWLDSVIEFGGRLPQQTDDFGPYDTDQLAAMALECFRDVVAKDKKEA